MADQVQLSSGQRGGLPSTRRDFCRRLCRGLEGLALLAPTLTAFMESHVAVLATWAHRKDRGSTDQALRAPFADYTHTLPNGSSLRIVGVLHAPVLSQADQGFMAGAIANSDVVILEGCRSGKSSWTRGYFEDIATLARAKDKQILVHETAGIRILKDLSMFAAHILSVGVGARSLAAARGREVSQCSSGQERTMRAGAWLSATLGTVNSLPRLAGTVADMPVPARVPKRELWDFAYLTSGRSVGFLAYALSVAAQRSNIRVLSVSGNGHATAMAKFLESPEGTRAYESKLRLYKAVYGLFLRTRAE